MNWFRKFLYIWRHYEELRAINNTDVVCYQIEKRRQNLPRVCPHCQNFL